MQQFKQGSSISMVSIGGDQNARYLRSISLFLGDTYDLSWYLVVREGQ